MSNSIIRFVIKFSVPEKNLANVKQNLESLIERCRDEPGLLCYEWFFNEDETELYAHEWYADPEAVTSHMEFGGETLGKLLEAAPPDQVHVYGNVPDALRERLAPFNATIVPYWKGFSRI